MPITMSGQADVDREALVDGGIGEIVVSGAHVLGSYLDGAGDEETKIHAGRACLASHGGCRLLRSTRTTVAARPLRGQGDRSRRDTVPTGR